MSAAEEPALQAPLVDSMVAATPARASVTKVQAVGQAIFD
jgi:hypothetical protein